MFCDCGVHCSFCRDLDKGRGFRKNVTKNREDLSVDFECPLEKPWGKHKSKKRSLDSNNNGKNSNGCSGCRRKKTEDRKQNNSLVFPIRIKSPYESLDDLLASFKNDPNFSNFFKNVNPVNYFATGSETGRPSRPPFEIDGPRDCHFEMFVYFELTNFPGVRLLIFHGTDPGYVNSVPSTTGYVMSNELVDDKVKTFEVDETTMENYKSTYWAYKLFIDDDASNVYQFGKNGRIVFAIKHKDHGVV